uniref:Uncharacterized protein n=1 Tax=Romanomermis culicivorax TaxID=13658 RepID=A0A915JDP1_ROMCU
MSIGLPLQNNLQPLQIVPTPAVIVGLLCLKFLLTLNLNDDTQIATIFLTVEVLYEFDNL